jgi:hypothetical protein
VADRTIEFSLYPTFSLLLRRACQLEESFVSSFKENTNEEKEHHRQLYSRSTLDKGRNEMGTDMYRETSKSRRSCSFLSHSAYSLCEFSSAEIYEVTVFSCSPFFSSTSMSSLLSVSDEKKSCSRRLDVFQRSF